MSTPPPTPDELIAELGLTDAPDIDSRLMEACDAELHAKPPRKQDGRLAFYCLRAILMRHWENPEPQVQQYVAGALLRRAQIFVQQDRINEGRWDFEEAWNRYQGSNDPAVRRIVAAVLLEAGNLERSQGDDLAAESWYEKTDRYIEDPDRITQRQVAAAQAGLADILFDRGSTDDGIEKADAVLARWQDDPDHYIRRCIADLMITIAAGMSNDEEHAEGALAAFDRTLAYTRRLDPPAPDIEATAMMEKGLCLENLKQFSEAIRCADDTAGLINREVRPNPLYTDMVPSIKDLVRRTYMSKTRCLLQLGYLQEAMEAFEAAAVSIADITGDIRRCQIIAANLTEKIRLLVDMGKMRDADDLYHAVRNQMFSVIPRERWDGETLAILAGALDYIQTRGR